MDYHVASGDFPIERDPFTAPDQHVTYSDGISRSKMNGEVFVELRKENNRRHLAGARNWPAHYLSDPKIQHHRES